MRIYSFHCDGNDIGTSQESVMEGAISSATFLVEHYEQIGKTILSLIEIYGVYKAACIYSSYCFYPNYGYHSNAVGPCYGKVAEGFRCTNCNDES